MIQADFLNLCEKRMIQPRREAIVARNISDVTADVLSESTTVLLSEVMDAHIPVTFDRFRNTLLGLMKPMPAS